MARKTRTRKASAQRSSESLASSSGGAQIERSPSVAAVRSPALSAAEVYQRRLLVQSAFGVAPMMSQSSSRSTVARQISRKEAVASTPAVTSAKRQAESGFSRPAPKIRREMLQSRPPETLVVKECKPRPSPHQTAKGGATGRAFVPWKARKDIQC